MKASLFSPLLILLILTLFAKASMLFGRIQEQTSYSNDTSTSSVLIDTAYAKSSDEAEKAKPAAAALAQPVEEKSKEEASSREKGEGKPKEPKAPAPKPVVPSAVMADGPGKVIDIGSANFSKSEMDLLKELAKRRDMLDKEKQAMTTREQILNATEVKIDQKVAELKTRQSQLEALMKQYDQKENGKILSLVKIYETMKPKEAAKILNELEMPVLIKVVSNMKEVKVAPIIASMDPAKARDLSIELAKQKPIE